METQASKLLLAWCMAGLTLITSCSTIQPSMRRYPANTATDSGASLTGVREEIHRKGSREFSFTAYSIHGSEVVRVKASLAEPLSKIPLTSTFDGTYDFEDTYGLKPDSVLRVGQAKISLNCVKVHFLLTASPNSKGATSEVISYTFVSAEPSNPLCSRINPDWETGHSHQKDGWETSIQITLDNLSQFKPTKPVILKWHGNQMMVEPLDSEVEP